MLQIFWIKLKMLKYVYKIKQGFKFIVNIIELSEPLHEILFFLLEIGVILGSLGVVLLTNIVYSAFFLGLVFFCISILYFVLYVDFVDVAQILIYVGAVNVLIVFAVMLINKL